MDKTLRFAEKFIPVPIYTKGQPIYHWLMAFSSAVWNRFPSQHVKIIGVTGTKGKSSTTEIINTILEEAGYKTAVSNTIRFKIPGATVDNLYKMSMPGRFFIQNFLRRAVNAKSDFVIMEITSQGFLQYRNRFIDLDTFVFTNLSPEHIESHGSYEEYVKAKVGIAKEIEHSSKPNRTLVINGDDAEAKRFLEVHADKKITYSLNDVAPYTILKEGIEFTLSNQKVHSPLSGIFNLSNILAAITVVKNFDVSDEIIIRALEKFNGIRGRVEKIEAGQNFTVIVDYAHTPDSLEKLFQLFQNQRIISVFGCTGGGRDTWKRKEMGRLADKYADEIILTDDDSYDEDINKIIADITTGIVAQKPTILIDRREAICEALRRAKPGDTVLITGKGTDPYLMGPNGTKIPWDDAQIVREELEKMGK